MAWESMTIYVVEFLDGGVRKHMQGYHQMTNMQEARDKWNAQNVGPPATGARRDRFETQTTAAYVTDVVPRGTSTTSATQRFVDFTTRWLRQLRKALARLEHGRARS